MTFRVDCHVKVLNDRVVERAKRAGLDALVYAPHFTRLPEIRERAANYADDELLVIPAREVFTGSWRQRRHVLAIGLEDPVPDYIPLETAMAEFDRQGAAVLVPHPTFANVSFEEADLKAHAETIDAIEIFNPKHFRLHNRRARTLAESLSLPPFTSSYAHLPRTVGVGHTAFEGGYRTQGGARDRAQGRDRTPGRLQQWPRSGDDDGVGTRPPRLREHLEEGRSTLPVGNRADPSHPHRVRRSIRRRVRLLGTLRLRVIPPTER